MGAEQGDDLGGGGLQVYTIIFVGNKNMFGTKITVIAISIGACTFQSDCDHVCLRSLLKPDEVAHGPPKRKTKAEVLQEAEEFIGLYFVSRNL